jgi:hypothetical protein
VVGSVTEADFPARFVDAVQVARMIGPTELQTVKDLMVAALGAAAR